MRSRRGLVAALCLSGAVLTGCGGAGVPSSGTAGAAGDPVSAGPALPTSAREAPRGGPGASPVAPDAVAVPVSVRIPRIALDEPLQDLGVAADGSAEVPADPDSAGWFTGGGRPGAHGPTVLLGHVDSTAGPAVFARLGELRPGDVVEVATAGALVARYAVTGTEQVPKGAFPTAAVFGATTEDVLRIITCTGEFDRSARSYLDNLIVSAVRV